MNGEFCCLLLPRTAFRMGQLLLLVLLCVVPVMGQKPPDVVDVEVVKRTETELTLEWNKVDNNNSYSYVLMFSNGTETDIPSPDNNPVVTHIISFLSPGTKYSFTLYTEFDNVRSSGYNFTNVTAPSNVVDVEVVKRTETELTLKLNKVNNDNNSYSYVLMFSNGTETNIPSPDNNPVVTHIISFLSPGTKYSFTLYTEFDNVRSSGYNFTNVTVPSNVVNASAVQSNDTAMILQWNTVTNTNNTTYNYTLKYSTESWEETLSINPEGNSVVRHQISDLIPATTYSFILYTIFDDVKSKGFTFTSSTTLSDVSEVRVTERSQTELTVEWDKLNKNSIYNYTLSHKDGIKVHFVGSEPNDVIRHTLSGLKPGTLYEFILNTVVKNQESRGFIFKNITTINCTSIAWNVTNSSIDADHVFGSTHVTAKNRTDDEVNKPVEQNRVNLQNLYPGATYTVSLLYHLESQQLLQCSQRLTLVPNSVSRLSCSSFSGGYGLTVVWEAPIGVVDVVQVDVAGKTFNQSGSRQEVDGLQVAQWYTVKATSFSRDMKSSTVSINCQTDPTGVIAGVLVFVLLVLLICAGVFLWRRKKKNVGGSKQHVESNVSRNKVYKPIPADKFPEHFHNLSRDENMGFSEEYEELGLVGLELSRDTAKMPENKSKNRFSNVLAYDVSRVRLSIDDNGDSDYINANYMPGYAGARKQYIAAQGPLPTTINDFWRMIWERRSQTIVMVTNCMERGSTKCEQYWPLDYTPCLYGNLLVTVTSEEKAQSWTLREFTVNNKDTSETRTVRHFHFTAWPDHGVPLGTEELITFRGLVRQHIESSSSAGPTVVHCSAGVGRTGTLIALDVMLQQLDRNRAVGIADFVQKMRLHRPLMVQTESQYVFLHQCIIDSLQPKDIPKPQEPLYENSDMIFANAMALKQYNKVSKNV